MAGPSERIRSSLGGAPPKDTCLPEILQSADKDLKIIIKYESNDNNDEIMMSEKEFWVDAHILCKLSKFVAAAVSADVKEKEKREITFCDVTPETLILAMEFLLVPAKARSMKPHDVAKVIDFYDRYEFLSGRQLCDEVLSEYFQEVMKQFDIDAPEDLDFTVRAAALVDNHDLGKSKPCAVDYLGKALTCRESQNFDRAMFSEEHLKLLHPMFVKGFFPEAVPDGTTKEELESACFPKYLFRVFIHENTCKNGRLWPGKLMLKGGYAEGDFYNDNKGVPLFYTQYHLPHPFWRKNVCFKIQKEESRGGDWAIVKELVVDSDVDSDSDSDSEVEEVEVEEVEVEEVLWKSPHSRNMELPLFSPWVPVHPRTMSQKPILEYKY